MPIRSDGPRHLIPLLSVPMVAAVLAVGCGGGEREEPAAFIPDGTPVAVASEARRSVGVVRGDAVEQFDDVRTPFLHRDSLLVVPVAGAAAIRVFGPDGQLVRSRGGPGEGPGEFRRLAAAWARGDTIEAFDAKLRRITRFTPAGSTEVVRLESGGEAQGVAPSPLPDGWALYGVESAGMGRRDTVAVHHFGRDGSHLGVISRVEGFSRYRTEVYAGPDPLSPKPVVTARAGLVYVAETLTPEIRVFSPGGELRREITWAPDSLASPEEAFAAVVKAAAASADPDRAGTVRKQLRSFPVRDRVPAFWDVIVDEAGFLWVEPYDPSKHSLQIPDRAAANPGSEWLIFAPDGRRVGAVRMPDGLEPTDITRDAVVGIHRDELGVEAVRVHRLRRHPD